MRFYTPGNENVRRVVREIDDFSLAELAELRIALAERFGGRLGWVKAEDPPPPPDVPPPDKPEGGSGVREPRRPGPPSLSGAAAVEPEHDEELLRAATLPGC